MTGSRDDLLILNMIILPLIVIDALLSMAAIIPSVDFRQRPDLDF
jgi:hypothetical protein